MECKKKEIQEISKNECIRVYIFLKVRKCDEYKIQFAVS